MNMRIVQDEESTTKGVNTKHWRNPAAVIAHETCSLRHQHCAVAICPKGTITVELKHVLPAKANCGASPSLNATRSVIVEAAVDDKQVTFPISVYSTAIILCKVCFNEGNISPASNAQNGISNIPR
jgi:hypothetical protein